MTAGDIGGFAGRMVGTIEDPITLLGLIFGVVVAAGVLRTTWGSVVKVLAVAAVLFASGVATGLLKLPAVLSWQRELGMEPDPVTIVATPGVAVLLFGGLILGAVKLAGAVWRRARKGRAS